MKRKNNPEIRQKGKASFFREGWNYISENRKYIWIALGIFIFFLLVALVFPAPEPVAIKIKAIINELLEKTSGLGTFELIRYIFLNNLAVSAISIIFGAIFCIVPFVSSAGNGYILGFVIKLTIEKLGGVDGTLSLWRLIPHGIFEFPAALISFAIGIKLGVSAFQSLGRSPAKTFLDNLKGAFKAFLFVIVPLLVIAAVIEGLLIIAVK